MLKSHNSPNDSLRRVITCHLLFFVESIIPKIYALLTPAVQPISFFCHASNKYLVTFIVNEKLC